MPSNSLQTYWAVIVYWIASLVVLVVGAFAVNELPIRLILFLVIAALLVLAKSLYGSISTEILSDD